MKKSITAHTCLGYTLFSAAANLAGAIAMLILLYFVSKSNDADLIRQHYVIFSLLDAAVAMAVTALLTGLYFHRKMPDVLSHEGDASPAYILKCFCRWVLPGEIVRLILCSLPTKPGMMFGYRFLDGFFALVPNYLWDMFYVIPNNRLDSMRELGYSATDNLVFLAIYTVYLAVLLIVYFFLFKTIWRAAETARRNEVKLHMNPDQMK